FIPERTIYLGFGHDEECYGDKGAKVIAKWMRDRGIKAELILDEGLAISSGLIPGLEDDVAMIGIAEKGTAYIELSVKQKPIHLSMPGNETAIDVLAKALLKIQKRKSHAFISTAVEEFFNHIGPELPFYKRMAFANKSLFKRTILRSYEKFEAGNACIRSTITPTLFKSGIIENSSPTRASVVLQVKVLPGDILEHLIEELIKTINEPKVEVFRVEKRYDDNMFVSPVSSKAYTIISKTIKQVFENAITTPALCIATTDSRHFSDISQNIYRFSPFRLTPENLGSIHGVNECIPIYEYHEAINFYIRLIKNMDHSEYQLSFTS
ncbi:MAG: M20/M25/M40 family metallo-hydrolase, partial [Bacteroidales bacterium]|nr:M20/M25/M40 family metallo-hydrolase [Bacteroidales bacterium]